MRKTLTGTILLALLAIAGCQTYAPIPARICVPRAYDAGICDREGVNQGY